MLATSPTMASTKPEPPEVEANVESDQFKDMSEHLLASTDMLLIVEGTELPCHKQVMAVHSKVFAGMADLVSSHEQGAHLCSKADRTYAEWSFVDVLSLRQQ